MRPRTTLILFLIAGLIGVAIIKMDRMVPSTRDREARAANPLPFDPDKVDGIEIDAGEASTTLRVENHLWHAGRPIADLADPERVKAILDALHDAEWLEHLSHAEMSEAAWKLTGLDKPAAHVTVTSAGRVVAECWLGNASAIEGASYLSVPGARHGRTDNYVVRTPLAQLLKKPMEEWRDSRLVGVPAESISRLTVSDGHGQIEMARDKPKSPWDLVKPLKTHGNNERINELLATLLALKITAVSPRDSAKTAPVADALHITIQTAAAAKPIEVVLARPADSVAGKTQATASHRKPVFTVSSDQLSSLWVQLNDLRDDRLARVDVESVDGIIVKSVVTGEVTLRKQGDSWQLLRSSQWEPANGDRVAKMFEALNSHRVKEFVADSAANLEPYGLNIPFLSVSWNESGVKPGAGPAPMKSGGKRFASAGLSGTETELLFGQDTQGNVFAKYDNEPIIYRVGASVLQALPRDNVRWKALNPVRFSQFSLLRIAITVGANPPVILDHHPLTSSWKGSRAGQDLTPLIDQVKADHLVDKLGGLVVQDWVQDRTDGTKALQTPAITLQVTLLTDAGNLKSPTKLITINFAPTVAGTDSALYFGRVDIGPDVFLINRDKLRELLASVLKD